MELKKEEGFTFKPAIKPYRRPQSARRARPNEKPESKIWERLHRQSQDVWKRQERLKKVKERMRCRSVLSNRRSENAAMLLSPKLGGEDSPSTPAQRSEHTEAR